MAAKAIPTPLLEAFFFAIDSYLNVKDKGWADSRIAYGGANYTIGQIGDLVSKYGNEMYGGVDKPLRDAAGKHLADRYLGQRATYAAAGRLLRHMYDELSARQKLPRV